MVARLYEDVICSIDDCVVQAHARGWCERHYRRWKHHGDPLGGNPTPASKALTPEELRGRLADNLSQIRNPIALATKYLAHRHLLGGRDQDDLMDVAIQSIVNAALSWDPNGGRSILSWAYQYLDRDIYRAIARRRREQSELGGSACLTEDASWLEISTGDDWFHRIELRIDLQRWADLAELTPYQRFVVDFAAHHHGVYVRDTPLAGAPSPLKKGAASYKTALSHMRNAAITGQRRDDKWTRARANREAA